MNRLRVTSAMEDMFSSFSVLSVSNFAQKNFPTDLNEIFMEDWQWANEQLMVAIRITVWIQLQGLFSGFVTIGRYSATLQCWACSNRHRYSNYDVITSLVRGGGMHCPSGSSSTLFCRFHQNNS